jgi:hypothetical protein
VEVVVVQVLETHLLAMVVLVVVQQPLYQQREELVHLDKDMREEILFRMELVVAAVLVLLDKVVMPLIILVMVALGLHLLSLERL